MTTPKANDPVGLVKEAIRLIELAMDYDDEVHDMLYPSHYTLDHETERMSNYIESQKEPNDDEQHRSDYYRSVL